MTWPMVVSIRSILQTLMGSSGTRPVGTTSAWRFLQTLMGSSGTASCRPHSSPRDPFKPSWVRLERSTASICTPCISCLQTLMGSSGTVSAPWAIWDCAFLQTLMGSSGTTISGGLILWTRPFKPSWVRLEPIFVARRFLLAAAFKPSWVRLELGVGSGVGVGSCPSNPHGFVWNTRGHTFC